MLGSIGVIVSLILLIYLAFKKWNPMTISIMASVIAGLTNQMPFWGTLQEVYVPGVLSFISSWLLIFTFGAVYSELLIQTGSAASIAYKLLDVFGKKLLFVMALFTLLLIYGGISSFVVIFILWPMMAVLSREANIPQRIWIAVFYLGLFAVNPLPGSPSLANIVVPALFDVSPTSGAFMGILSSVIYFATGYIILMAIMKRYEKKGIKYEKNEREDALIGRSREDCPKFMTAVLPMLVMVVLFSSLSNGWLSFIGIEKMQVTFSVMTAMLIACLLCVILNFKVLRPQLKQILMKGSMGGINPLITGALITGYVAVVSSTPAYAGFIEWILGMPGHPYMQMFVAGSLIAMLAGNPAVSAPLVCNSFGAAWMASGAINTSLIRPLLTTCFGGTSILPHSGGLFGVMEYTGQDHDKSYMAAFLVCVIPTFTTTLILIGLALLFY